MFGKFAPKLCEKGSKKGSNLLRHLTETNFNPIINCLSHLSTSHEMPESPQKSPQKPSLIALRFEKITENGFRPTKGSKFAAGYDLYSAYDCVVPKRGKQMVKTDIRVAVPHGCYGRVAPRSGLAWKHSIDVGAGVIDSDYRGNVCVILFNFCDEDFNVSKGDRIAQLICERIADTELIESNLDSTDRHNSGFGSTRISLKDSNH